MDRLCAETAARQDEEFWRRNERYFTERMGQPCCTLAGVSQILAHMPGDFAVVVHGEMDCLNNFPHFEGVSLPRFYCTNLSQREFVGDAARPLRECLEAVIERRSPKVVFVLSMCLMEMIHDDFPAVAAEVSSRTGVPIVPLRTSGLEVVSQAEYTDMFYALLADLFPDPGRREPDLVNTVGLPALDAAARAELTGILAAAGLRLNASFPLEASLDDWRRLKAAGSSLIVDTPLYPKFLRGLRSSRAASHEAPLPVGWGPTSRFYGALGAGLRREEPVARAAAERAESARRAVSEFKKRRSGLRLAMGLRMANFAKPGQLALDGLAEAEAFVELGFEVTLLIQGPPELKSRGRFQERLQGLGCGLPVMVFAEPNELPGYLGGGRFDAAYLGDHAREHAREAGVVWIGSQSLRPFFCGVEANLAALSRCLSAP